MGIHDMQVENLDDFLTPREVAALLPRTSVDTVRRMIRNGDLPAIKTYGGHWLVRRADALALRHKMMTQLASEVDLASLAAEPLLSSELPA